MVSPWPFLMWGMNVIGHITPKATNDHRFNFVVIDYFTKWVEATSYASVTKSMAAWFIKKKIICRYELPDRIISDNSLNLNNDMITEVCTRFKIKHHNSVPYRPKMNGEIEVANKNVKKIITKATETYKDWHEKLPFALHAYRTRVWTSTGATPYSLVYGMEAVLPIEVKIPSLRVLREVELEKLNGFKHGTNSWTLLKKRGWRLFVMASYIKRGWWGLMTKRFDLVSFKKKN